MTNPLASGSIDTVKPYVARGLGLAVVPGICLAELDRAVFETVPIPAEFDGATTYGVVLRKDKHLSDPLRWFLPLLGVRAEALGREGRQGPAADVCDRRGRAED